MPTIGPGPNRDSRERRIQGNDLNMANGRRVLGIPNGDVDPTPGTTNLITGDGDRLITGDGDELIVRP